MPSFNGIQDVMNRIQSIQSQFTQPPPSVMNATNAVSFDASLKMAMNNPDMPMNGMGGPDSLQSLLNSMGPNARFNTDMSQAGQKLVETAKQWEGKEFKPGQTARCADFVSTMIEQSGVTPPNFKHEINCFELQKQGKQIEKKDLKPGDIVYFGYTYMPVDYTHVGIYVGDGKVVHRPTCDKPVQIDSIETGYYADKYSSARRLY